jgi:hypothetical protein
MFPLPSQYSKRNCVCERADEQHDELYFWKVQVFQIFPKPREGKDSDWNCDNEEHQHLLNQPCLGGLATGIGRRLVDVD